MKIERQNRIKEVLEKRQNNITVILENVEDPHNTSAVLRSADAVGITEVYIINNTIIQGKDRFRYARRSSGSAIKWLQIHEYDNVTECIAAVKKKYNKIVTTHLSATAKTIYETNFIDSIAIAFGNEADGCSQELLAAAHSNIIIPQVGFIKSLNISVACAVTLFEAFRQKQIAGHYNHNNLSNAEKATLIELWDMKQTEAGEIVYNKPE